MLKQGCFITVNLFILLCLSGCFGGLWTGANMVYNRHEVYKKIDNYRLYLDVNRVLSVDNLFKNNLCSLDIVVFNGDILLAGHVPTSELREELRQRLTQVKGYRRLFNYITLNPASSNSAQDAWITTKIRTQIVTDGSIDPNAFKIVTSDRIVYLMGDVHEEQAKKVILIARKTKGVGRVVTIFKYFTYKN